MFCVSCGKEIEDGSLFCEHCGAKQETAGQAAVPAQEPAAVNQQAAPVQTAPVETAPIQTAPAAPKQPMSPKTKLVLAIVAGVVVLFFALKMILGAVNDPTKTVNNFLNAIRNQDSGAFRKAAVVGDLYKDSFELTDETLTPFFNAYSKDNDKLSSMQSVLMEDLTYINRGMVAPGDGFLRLVEKSNFLFDSYKVEITPPDFTLYSEFDGTKLTMNGVEYTVGYDGVKTKMLPGAYSGTAVYTDTATGITLNNEFENVYLDGYNDYFQVEFDYTSAYIESSSDILQLKEIEVDGKKLDMDMSQFNFYYGFELRPVNADSKIRVVATAYGMDFEQTFDMTEGSSCYFTGELTEEMQEKAYTLCAEAAPLWMQVVFSYSQEACDTMVNNYGSTSSEFTSSLSEELSRRLKNMNEYPQYYSYRVLSDLTIGDISEQDISFYSDGLYLRMYVPITGTSVYYPEWGSTVTDHEPESVDGDIYVSLKYADGNWAIDSMNGLY